MNRLVDGIGHFVIGLLGPVLRHTFFIVTVLLAVAGIRLFVVPLATVQSTLSQFEPPDVVAVPVPRNPMPEGSTIDNPDDVQVITTERFTRPELGGMVMQKIDLKHTIVKQLLLRGQPIPRDAIEAYVTVPVPAQPIAAGARLGVGQAAFDNRALAQSQIDGSEVTDAASLVGKLAIAPLAAEKPIPQSSRRFRGTAGTETSARTRPDHRSGQRGAAGRRAQDGAGPSRGCHLEPRPARRHADVRRAEHRALHRDRQVRGGSALMRLR